MERDGLSTEKLGELGVGRLKLAALEGDTDKGFVMAGQIAGLIKDIKPCKEIIEDIIKEAKKRMETLASLKGGLG